MVEPDDPPGTRETPGEPATVDAGIAPRPDLEILRLELTRLEKHDLFNPLNRVIGYCEVMIEEVEEDGQPGDVETLRKILTAANSLSKMLTDILKRAHPAGSASLPGATLPPADHREGVQ